MNSSFIFIDLFQSAGVTEFFLTMIFSRIILKLLDE